MIQCLVTLPRASHQDTINDKMIALLVIFRDFSHLNSPDLPLVVREPTSERRS